MRQTFSHINNYKSLSFSRLCDSHGRGALCSHVVHPILMQYLRNALREDSGMNGFDFVKVKGWMSLWPHLRPILVNACWEHFFTSSTNVQRWTDWNLVVQTSEGHDSRIHTLIIRIHGICSRIWVWADMDVNCSLTGSTVTYHREAAVESLKSRGLFSLQFDRGASLSLLLIVFSTCAVLTDVVSDLTAVRLYWFCIRVWLSDWYRLMSSSLYRSLFWWVTHLITSSINCLEIPPKVYLSQ